MTSTTILEVAVPTPLRRSFDYLPPEDSTIMPRVGCRVRIPFGRQTLIGIITAVKNHSDIDKTKLLPALEILDDEALLDQSLIELMQWASDYYQYAIGECMQLALPSLLRKGEALLDQQITLWQLNPAADLSQIRANAKSQLAIIHWLQQHQQLTAEQFKAESLSRDALNTLKQKNIITEHQQLPELQLQVEAQASTFQLNSEQQQAVDDFRTIKGFQPVLLEGVTGSGKTEVYLQIMAQVLQQGKQVIVLVPEIGLTPQTLQRFNERFACTMAIFHSNLSDRERLHHWQQARSGEARIIIGTRSALFCSCPDLGLIIIDEEHDLSYKQQDGLRYSARDLACVRAKLGNFPIVMGSATPTLETLHNASLQKYRHWILNQRAGNASAPDTRIIDIRHHAMHDGIAEETLQAIDICLQQQEQCLIFINRRGFAPSLICHDCGWTGQCHACDARLTIHLHARHLRCHHCQAIEPIPHQCPNCHSASLVYEGIGTERVETGLREHFPDTPIYRIDRDTTSGKYSMPDMLNRIQQHQAAILVGTQMLAKGHHFPNVTLVVILESDNALMSNDYRATERFGQLLTQVIGRAGRAEKPGQALIQTHYPKNAELNKLVDFGYHRFAMDLLAERDYLKLPPFSFHALIRLEDKNASKALQTLQQLQHSISLQPCQTFGPFPAMLQRRAHFFRYQLLIQCQSRAALKHCVGIILDAAQQCVAGHRQRFSIDIDPQDMS